MIETVTLFRFQDAFRDAGRTGNFTYKGLELLYNYFNELEDDIGEPVELDVVAICCEYSEDEPLEIADNYGIDLSDVDQDDDDAVMEAVQEYLEGYTAVIGRTDSTIVYELF